MAETCEVLVTVSETSDMSHNVFFLRSNSGTKACTYHEECGTKQDLESNGGFELPVELVLRNARATGKNGNSGLYLNTYGLGADRGADRRQMTIMIANSNGRNA